MNKVEWVDWCALSLEKTDDPIRIVENKPALMVCLTGLNLAVAAFMELLPALRAAYEADLEQRDQQRAKPRERRRGAGQKGVLPKLEDKLVFILFYFRLYPVQRAQGFFFGMGQPQANEWIHRLTPILNQALGYEMQLPAREQKSIQQVLSECPDLECIVDGTERPIRRDRKTRSVRKTTTVASRSAIPARTTSSATSAAARSRL